MKCKIVNVPIGMFASIVGIIAIFPMVYNSSVHHAVKDIHYFWLILSLVSNLLWIYYGISNSLVPNIFNAVINFGIIAYMFRIKLKYGQKRENDEIFR